MALPLYAVTLFVSAFILFLVQPIVGKIILPKLGGTPQVWNTCMVFFQMVLLAGYAYTHNVSTRLTLKQQLIAHLVLLAVPLIVLLPFPFALGGEFMSDGVTPNPNSLWGFMPVLGTNPIPSTLTILFMYVALPFLVVSTTAPLLQKWFVFTGHPASKDPYFLYGASNMGSMLSLIFYPILIEPLVPLKMQGWMYTGGYIALAGFVLACAAMVWNASEPKLKLEPLPPEPKPEPAPAAPATTAAPQTGITATAPPATSGAVKAGQPGKTPAKHGVGKVGHEPALALGTEEVTGARRFRWILLAAVPSSLMLGITTHITTDLSPIPLFWLIPLILYLLSFILVFARWPVVWTEQPHTYFLWAQPFCIALMILVDVLHLTNDTNFLMFAIFAHVAGFFTTTMVCHGELAKDRPSTRYLTEFYLCMSVGGMLGGVFNGLVAPIIFKKLWELPLAIFAASFLRPKMFEQGFLDNWLANMFQGKAEATDKPKPGQKGHKPVARGEIVADESFSRTLDYAWPVATLVILAGLIFALSPARSVFNNVIDYGVPLALACACLARPLRLGLTLGVVLLVFNASAVINDPAIVTKRSYFGAMSIKENQMQGLDKRVRVSRSLIHGHIDHGMNFLVPEKGKGRGDPDIDWSRLATTYYHREGPVGRVMEMKKFNPWAKVSPPNTYHADARLPAAMVGQLAGGFGIATLTEPIVGVWSEPPFATVGLGTGTMASYGRVYQHVHFYEIDDIVRRFSLAVPSHKIQDFKQYEKEREKERDPTYFNYLERAIERGSHVQCYMGDARLRMAMPYKPHYNKDKDGNYTDQTDPGGGPEKFYHMMVVDAFSSDAIPAHLLTVEAFKMYFEHLTEDGILCVHTSNRFVDLPKVVAAISDKLGLAHLRGHDNNDVREKGHYTSEWVIVARKQTYLAQVKNDDNAFQEQYRKALAERPDRRNRPIEQYWAPVSSHERYLWTDDYYNLMSVIRFGFSRRDDD